MNRSSVVSSDIRSIGYEPSTCTLEIEFHGGRVYQYAGVPAPEFERLSSAASKGSHFHDHMKDRFPCIRVG
jgi:hypothetical protein